MFHRYEPLFGSTRNLIIVSALTFGLAHLFFANLLAPLLSTVGGYIFARTYARSAVDPPGDDRTRIVGRRVVHARSGLVLLRRLDRELRTESTTRCVRARHYFRSWFALSAPKLEPESPTGWSQHAVAARIANRVSMFGKRVPAGTPLK